MSPVLESLPASATHQLVEQPIEVSIVMPCLNEARTVGSCVRKALNALAELQIKGEVIVADNGSSDSSKVIASEHGATVIHVPEPGYGSALQGGIAAARGKYIIIGDCDESYDFGAIKPFIERLRAGDELVMGNRFQGGIRPGAMPWHHRYIGNPVLTGILNLFFHTPIGDAHCGLRAFRKESILKLGLTSPGMEFASEMVVKAQLHGQRITEVPTVLYPDGRDRPPHLRSLRDGWRHLRFLLLMCSFWVFLIPGSFITLAGLLLIAFGAFGSAHSGTNSLEAANVLGNMLVILGFQTLWFWSFAKILTCQPNVVPIDKLSLYLRHSITLERGIAMSAAFFLSGFAFILLRYYFSPEAQVEPTTAGGFARGGLFGFTLIILGMQIFFGSFFLGAMRMTQTQACSPMRANYSASI